MFRFDSRRRLFDGFKSQGLWEAFSFYMDCCLMEFRSSRLEKLIRWFGGAWETGDSIYVLIAFRITSNNAPKFLAQRFDTRSENSYKFSTTSALTTLKISARIAPKNPFFPTLWKGSRRNKTDFPSRDKFLFLLTLKLQRQILKRPLWVSKFRGFDITSPSASFLQFVGLTYVEHVL